MFSSDNKKVFYPKDTNKAILHSIDYHPCFWEVHYISIDGNPLKENKLYLNQHSYNYKGNLNFMINFLYLDL